MQHELKSRPEFFEDIVWGRRQFDIRKRDRPFMITDTVLLREHNHITQKYTGRTTVRRVTSILGHRPGAGCAAEFGLKPGYVILGLERMS